jgi:hypothetical protein
VGIILPPVIAQILVGVSLVTVLLLPVSAGLLYRDLTPFARKLAVAIFGAVAAYTLLDVAFYVALVAYYLPSQQWLTVQGYLYINDDYSFHFYMPNYEYISGDFYYRDLYTSHFKTAGAVILAVLSVAATLNLVAAIVATVLHARMQKNPKAYVLAGSLKAHSDIEMEQQARMAAASAAAAEADPNALPAVSRNFAVGSFYGLVASVGIAGVRSPSHSWHRNAKKNLT